MVKKNRKKRANKKQIKEIPQNQSSKLQRIGLWSGLVLSFIGILIGINSYLSAKRNEAVNRWVEAQKYLAEANDIIGGEPGTTKIIAPKRTQQKLELARRRIQQALILEPNNPDCLKIQGNYLHLVGNNEEAIIFYEKAIEIDPNYYAAYNNMGSVFSSIGNNKLAIESYNKAIEINPKDRSAYYNLGNVFQEMKDNNMAVKEYNMAIELDPQFSAAFGNLGNSLADLGLDNEAIDAYKESIRLKPTAVIYNKLGQILFKQGEADQSEKACRECLELEHGFAPCYLGLGGILASKGKSLEAERVFQEVIKLDPNLAPAYFALCHTLLDQKKFAEAEIIFKKGAELLNKSEWKDWADANVKIINTVSAKLIHRN